MHGARTPKANGVILAVLPVQLTDTSGPTGPVESALPQRRRVIRDSRSWPQALRTVPSRRHFHIATTARRKSGVNPAWSRHCVLRRHLHDGVAASQTRGPSSCTTVWDALFPEEVPSWPRLSLPLPYPPPPASLSAPLPVRAVLPWALFVGLLMLVALYFVGAEQGATAVFMRRGRARVGARRSSSARLPLPLRGHAHVRLHCQRTTGPRHARGPDRGAVRLRGRLRGR